MDEGLFEGIVVVLKGIELNMFVFVGSVWDEDGIKVLFGVVGVCR